MEQFVVLGALPCIKELLLAFVSRERKRQRRLDWFWFNGAVATGGNWTAAARFLIHKQVFALIISILLFVSQECRNIITPLLTESQFVTLFIWNLCVWPPQVQGRGLLEQSEGGGHPPADSHWDRVHLGAVPRPGRARGHRLWHRQLQLQERNHTYLYAQPPERLHEGNSPVTSFITPG